MSFDDHRGVAWAYRELMRGAQDEIARGERRGARRLWLKPHPKLTIGWFKRRVLRGEFRQARATDRRDATHSEDQPSEEIFYERRRAVAMKK